MDFISRDGRTNEDFFASASVEDLVACLDKSFNPNSRNASGVTPLHWAAAESDNAEMLDILLMVGANLHARDMTDRTPLHWAAAFSKNPQVISVLIDACADSNARDTKGVAPLHLAVSRNGNPAIVAELVRKGADPNACDNDKWTPLHWAAAFGEGRTRDLMDKMVAVVRGKAAVRYSRSKPDSEPSTNAHTFKILLEADSNPHAQNREGYQALHLAAAGNTAVAVTTLLLEYGAEPNETTPTAQTPLSLALAFEGGDNSEVIEALLSADANLREPESVVDALKDRVKRDAIRADKSVEYIVRKYTK